MKVQTFTGEEKFASKTDDRVKIEHGGNGHDPDENISLNDVDDIWENDALSDMPKEKAAAKDAEEGAEGDEIPRPDVREGREGKEAKTKEEKAKEKILEALLSDGQKLPISASSKFPVTIRGEESLVSVQDLINNYSGDKDFHNLYNNLNRERQIFENQRAKFQKSEESWNNFSKSVAERIKSGDPEKIIDAWEDIIDKTGVDPSQFSHFLVKSLMPSIQRYSSMTPEEQKLYDRQVELDARQRSYDRSMKKQEMEKVERERAEFVDQITREVEEKNKAYGFSMSDFDNAFKKLQDLQGKGHFEGEIAPDTVYAFLMKENVEKKAQDLLTKEAPELSKDKGKASEFVKYVLKHVMTDFWSKDMREAEYYEGLAKDYLAKLSAKEVSRKVATAKPSPEVVKRRPGQKPQAAKSPLKTTKDVSSDDLSFLQNGHVDW